jgi:hypothetical protein
MKRFLLMPLVFVMVLLCSCSSSGTAKTAVVTTSSALTPTTASGIKTTTTSTPAHPALQTMGVTGYIDENGYYHLVGEVLNSGNSNMENIEIIATYFDAAGTVIGTGNNDTELYVLPVNTATPFDIIASSKTIQPATYKLGVQGDMTTDQPFPGLTVQNTATSIDDTGCYDITGQVNNSSTKPAGEVKIIATYYDAAKNVIGTSFVYTKDSEIAAGHITTFDLSSYPQQIKPASYKLQIDAQ